MLVTRGAQSARGRGAVVWQGALLLLVVAAALMAACGDSTPGSTGGGNPSLSLVQNPELSVQWGGRYLMPSDTLEVPLAGDVGVETLAGEVTITNTGASESTLEVSEVTIESSPAGAFRLAGRDGADLPTAAAPWEVASFGAASPTAPLQYTVQMYLTRPADGVDARATLTLRTNDLEHDRAVVTYELVVDVAQPSLSLTPSVLDFGDVGAGETGSLSLTVANTGTAELVLDGFMLSGATGYALVDGQGRWETSAATTGGVDFSNPIGVVPGHSYQLKVEYTPEGPEAAKGLLRLLSNDPETGEAGAPVVLQANTGGACIAVSPKTVDFGGKLVGQVATMEVAIQSCGDSPLEIRGLRLLPQSEVTDVTVSPDYQLDLSGLDPALAPGAAQIAVGDAPVVLPVGADGVRTFKVTYVPDTVNPVGTDGLPLPDLGRIEILSNSFAATTLVDVRGFGVATGCPHAEITVAEGEEVVPQTNLHLSSTSSTSPNGAITAWQWTVEQPNGSASVFLPSGTMPQPTFEANVAGSYIFHLEVWDIAGEKSCNTASYQVLVIPDEAIHVELLWNTPADPDQTDETYQGGPEVGSDVDLHFFHPFAFGPLGTGAFDTKYDCFWFNDNPDWGSADPAVDDDPGLDRDDTDGAGPENVNLNIPQPGMKYQVSVHYWDDHGYGHSLATVRVYIYSNLVWQVQDIPLDNLDWCDVANIAWPSGAVTPYSPSGPGYTCHGGVTWL